MGPLHECGDCGELADDLATHRCAPTVGPPRWSTDPDTAREQMAEALWDMCVTVPRHVGPSTPRRQTWRELHPELREAARASLWQLMRNITAAAPLVDQDQPHAPEATAS
ncbi:hypothetical protein PZ938_02985 [Luteipulveratus sp. YIM 133132]|uniref:hypothetical protein n=1 Tax=Luteipulveratus flavus TaxID=3031728 RepID=UPI0023B0530A|nr:hypothetical protein [Luteipulveratus sp. YIM 133132]MDE9364557.1 hypothetical protein [Luteipulveratus sp. YIM 133132]